MWELKAFSGLFWGCLLFLPCLLVSQWKHCKAHIPQNISFPIFFEDSLGYLIVCPYWYLLLQAAVTGSFAVKCPPLSYFSALKDFLVRQKTNKQKTRLCVGPSWSPQVKAGNLTSWEWVFLCRLPYWRPSPSHLVGGRGGAGGMRQR